MERRAVDIHKKVDCTFPRKKDHVAVQVEMLGCIVHLKCFLNKSESDEETHQCTESHLDYICNLGPNGRNTLDHARRETEHLVGGLCMTGKWQASCYSVHDSMKPCFYVPSATFRVLTTMLKTRFGTNSMMYNVRRVPRTSLDRWYNAHTRKIIATTSTNEMGLEQSGKKPHILQHP